MEQGGKEKGPGTGVLKCDSWEIIRETKLVENLEYSCVRSHFPASSFIWSKRRKI